MQIIQEIMAKQPLDSKLAYRTCFSSLSYYGHKLYANYVIPNVIQVLKDKTLKKNEAI